MGVLFLVKKNEKLPFKLIILQTNKTHKTVTGTNKTTKKYLQSVAFFEANKAQSKLDMKAINWFLFSMTIF